jgi:Subtilisin inhibitor-like
MGMTSELKQGTARILTGGALVAACGLAAAACGSAAAPSATGSGGSSAAATSAAKVSLTVTQTGGSGTTAKHWTLRCEPAGGSFPDPASACAKLTQLRTIFNPTPGQHVMCPMIMADARTYIVYGTFLGQKVHQRIVDGGCTLARWNKLNQIFN